MASEPWPTIDFWCLVASHLENPGPLFLTSKFFYQIFSDTWKNSASCQLSYYKQKRMNFNRVQCHPLFIHAPMVTKSHIIAHYAKQHLGAITTLLWAAANGHVGLVNLVLPHLVQSKGPSVICLNVGIKGMAAVHAACLAGHIDIVALLLDTFPLCCNMPDRRKLTPLHHACATSNTSLVALLLQRGADVNSKARHGSTPLHVAILNRAPTQLIQLLLQSGADVAIVDKDHQLPIHVACRQGSADVVQLLACHVGNINVLIDDQGLPCLHWAARLSRVRPRGRSVSEGLFSVLQKRLTRYVHIHCSTDTCNHSNSLSHSSSQDTNTPILAPGSRCLGPASRGASTSTPHAVPATDHAARAMDSSTDVIMLLCELGADPTQRDTDGMTPLHHAAKHGCTAAAAQLLFFDPSTINLRDEQGYSPVFVACMHQHHTTLSLLLEARADPNVMADPVNTTCTSPLHYAANEPDPKAVELLTRHGADVDRVNDERVTPLMLACGSQRYNMQQQQRSVISLLLSCGADPNARDESQWTALHYHVDFSCEVQPPVIAQMLMHGADPNIQNNDGATVLVCAIKSGDLETASLLLKLCNPATDPAEPPLIPPVNADDGGGGSAGSNASSAVNASSSEGNGGGSPLADESTRARARNIALNVNLQDDCGRAALHYACLLGNEQLAAQLVSCGAQLGILDKAGRSPLHLACVDSNPLPGCPRVVAATKAELVELLLKAGAAEALCAQGVELAGVVQLLRSIQPPTQKAAGRMRLLKHLAMPVLHRACERGYMHTVALLVSHPEVDLDQQHSTNGYTALHCASLAGQAAVVEVLLGKGADVNVMCKRRRTALHLACITNQEEVVKLLLRHQVRVDVVDNNGMTALCHALRGGFHDITLQLLRHAGVSLVRGKHGMTRLHQACKRGDVRQVALLLQHGAVLDVEDDKGLTPLWYACRSGSSEVVQVLQRHRAEVALHDVAAGEPEIEGIGQLWSEG